MKNQGVKLVCFRGIFSLILIISELALVANGDKYVELFEEVPEEFTKELVYYYKKHNNKPNDNNITINGGPTTLMPNVGVTVAESNIADFDLEDDWLLPGEEAEEDLVKNREKREVVGSGVEPIICGILSLNTVFAADLTDSTSQAYATFKAATETAIFNECQPIVSDLSSINVQSFDVTNSRISFQFIYTSTKERALSAQCLRNIQLRQSIEINGINYVVIKDPFIDNSADQSVAAICLLCPAQEICLQDLKALFYCGSSSLFTHGTSQNDKALANGDDGVSDSINFLSGIPFGSTLREKVYVSINGFMSFISTAGPVSRVLASSKYDVIAPFWIDIDTTMTGNVYYHYYNSNPPISAVDKLIIDRATDEVNRFAFRTDFASSEVVVATWDRVMRRGQTDVSKTVTFQVVLISDGTDTYIIQFYENFLWTSKNGVKITIGYGSKSTATKNPYSRSLLAFNMDINNGNTGHNGMWFYKVNSAITGVNYGDKCINFYTAEAAVQSAIDTKNSEVPACPCTKAFLTFNDVLLITDSNRICYVLNTFEQFGTYARLCCYAPSSDELLISDPLSGSLLRYNPIYHTAEYQSSDFDPWQDCCLLSGQCNYFHQVRPKKTCTTSSTAVFVFGFGDPHIATLDGKFYTFNGLGLFTFLKISSQINIQMRTARVLNDAGAKMQATIYAGFVGRDASGAHFQIEMSPTRHRLIVFFMGIDVTAHFYNTTDYSVSESGIITLRRTDTDAADVSFSNGISLKVTLKDKMLQLAMSVADEFKSQTTGLVGNYDGDKTNDLISRNGTTLPDTDDDKLIFPIAMTWSVQEQDSLFLYHDGLFYSDYNFPEFVPFYTSDASDGLKTEAENVCGGSTQRFCLYDYMATRSSTIARNTKETETQNQLEIVKLANINPTITSDKNQINVKVGETVDLILQASDPTDTVTIIIVDSPSTGFNFNSATRKVTWNPANNNVANLTFQAEDAQGGKSPELRIEITLCSICSGRGVCHDNETRNSPNVVESNLYFKLFTCTCNNGFDGADCENEVDACNVDPCDPLQTCTDKTGALSQSDVGYICSSCPSGFTADSTKCTDTDECLANSDICNTTISTCLNSEGSFSCVCNTGYRLIDNVCVDIDECIDKTHNCVEVCVNTQGNFTCECSEPTFSIDNGCTGTTRCTTLPHGCEYGCKVISMNDTCYCEAFQELAADQKNCQDVDECATGIKTCAQICNNTNPGFSCSCHDGYKLSADSITCEVCTEETWGTECSKKCECKGRGTCNAATGCICVDQWKGTDCSTDVDECTDNPDICGTGTICSNLPGSYECLCPSGYEKIVSECKDINECDIPDKNTCNQICINTPASFTCSCFAGYLFNNGVCEDIDECNGGNHGCEQICVNQIGSYNCMCSRGFQLRDDRKLCMEDPSRDPCSSDASLNCAYGCRVNNSQTECYCSSGFYIAADGKSCLDVNECQGSHGCVGSCTNTNGSFTCGCPIGTEVANDGKSCTDCVANKQWGINCANDCQCSSLGTTECNKETGCICKAGWRGVKCDEDIDECNTPTTCSVTNTICVNTQGSYVCNCASGFTLSADKTACEDVDECKDDNLNTCEQTCTNNVGSFVCSCFDGFIQNTTTSSQCDDVDECSSTGSNPCEQKCRNVAGSFVCECNSNFQLNADRRTCTATIGCIGTQCSDLCARVDSVEVCSCPQGKTLNADNLNCDGIDECAAASNPCINGNCADEVQGFTCSCPDGFDLQSDRITCTACQDGFYGANCSSSCSCSSTNTESCDKVNGTCYCKSGWEGSDCTTNINECQTTVCSAIPNSRCVDTLGSYICQCNTGFFSSNGICQACDDTHWGNNCLMVCSCKTDNTLTCDKSSGACTCLSTWTGSTCEEDVNECSPNNPCTAAVPNCENTNGSHVCNCNAGFTKTSSTTCENINECLYTDLNTCTNLGQTCVDNVGNFSCGCQTGYLKIGNACQDIDECIVNNGGCKETCTDSDGSFICSCPTGQQLNPQDKVSCYVVAASSTQSMTVQLDITDQDAVVQDSNLYTHTVLKDNIAQAVYNELNKVSGTGIIHVTTSSLSLGSVIAQLDLLTNNLTNSEASALSKAVYDMVQQGSLNIDGASKNIIVVTKDGVNITKDDKQCDILPTLKACESTEVCEVVNDFPVCSVPVTETEDIALIVGLSAGIPLFFIVMAILACLIYYCIKRRQRRAGSDRIHHSEPRDPFQSVFSGPVPKRGGWAASRYGLYSPDTLSQATSVTGSSSDDGKLLKSRNKPGAMDFRDSAWNDNRSFAYPHSQPEHSQAGNFSWEHMFRSLEPLRNFEIRRPNIQGSPVNPLRGRRPDSMA